MDITIKDFKNVANGTLSFENTRKNYKASILGLYGQNGSGKTALIDAISLLKLALSGLRIPIKFADFINVESEFAHIKYVLKVENPIANCQYDVTYEFKLKKELDETTQNVESADKNDEKFRTVIFDEILSCSYDDAETRKILKPLIDTSVDSELAFEPKNKFELLVGKDKKVWNDVYAFKTIASHTSRSFIFSRELLNVIRKNSPLDEKYHYLIEALVYYGNYGLFVFNTTNTGLISLNALPLSFKIEEKNSGTIGNLMIKLEGATSIPQEAVQVVKKVIDNMNVVLQQIIPGLTIGVKEGETDILPNNKVGSKIYLVSNKNHKEIPLKYESEGIKKIVSILQLLIVVYNKPHITVAIDELDSGVFEYLLGELLRIISEKGKGQLIFTSHNLRPLETLDKGFIAFTTTNPSNRYIRFSNVKSNNNLRDFYYRDIILGEQSEIVYEHTNNYEIALAFREAGEFSGS
jgi:AAA15 family ATPase/GTPase